jgi:hypothetical protein
MLLQGFALRQINGFSCFISISWKRYRLKTRGTLRLKLPDVDSLHIFQQTISVKNRGFINYVD